MDSDTESKLISLITRLISREDSMDSDFESPWVTVLHSKVPSYIIQIISLLGSMDLDPQLKPESSELMSLVTEAISIFNSMDLDSQPKSLSDLISLLSPIISPVNSIDSDQMHDEIISLIDRTLFVEPELKLLSLIYQIFSLVISMNSKWEKLISLSPQTHIRWQQGKFHMDMLDTEVTRHHRNKWNCFPLNWEKFRLTGEDATHVLCLGCFGQNHEEYNKAPVEMQHTLHRKQPLQLVLLSNFCLKKECYCCDEYLRGVLLFCSTCGFAMNLGCVGKQHVLSIYHPKWHEHPLALFPRQTSLTCNLCALAEPSSPLYMCPSCDFVVHLRCTNVPRVIRICRHPHRISFTHSLDQGDCSCSVCRTNIDKHYGCYSCVKDGCSYVAHSRCATQSNVWDDKELEGELEEAEEEVAEPFVKIREGVIQHFSHQEHHLTLDTNTCKDYDDSKLCQACISPIYFGNFYSCMQCDFILHEECANLSRKIHHPIHPHLLTLRGEYNNVINFHKNACTACSLVCKGCFLLYVR
ncbi:unnamed protein product [Microthlaspi erraticum]|uniref:DC1 domain-containing protein n=1 Tax=Microthlaspi erraticum TaxID=1685480 RepID=A0A6D2KNU5_9BRAS|nr:unnamed protein product [Microthlaspi erraticum]